jgi:hypothetical protein
LLVPADVGPQAYELFLRARAAVTAVRYPASLDYTIAVSGLDGQTPRANHYRASSRPAEGVIDVASVSAEEEQHPVVVRGFNFAFTASICGGRCETGTAVVAVPAGRTPSTPDLIGVPILDPTYSFGLRYPEPKTNRTSASASNLKTIAVVATQTRDYDVTLLDTPPLDGTPTYRLRLRPLRKPHDNRLRELWIGQSDFLPRRAVIAGDFTIAPLVDVPWVVDFTVRSDCPYVDDEVAQSTLYLAHRRVVRNAVISFQDVREAEGGSFLDRPLLQPQADETTLVEPNRR